MCWRKCSPSASPIQVRSCCPTSNYQLTVEIDPVIRRTVLENLNEKFDQHLAQAENIRCLFIALNDEVFHNRELAIGVIGRLAMHNPAYVMPHLRRSLINLITELEYTTAMCVTAICGQEHADRVVESRRKKVLVSSVSLSVPQQV